MTLISLILFSSGRQGNGYCRALARLTGNLERPRKLFSPLPHVVETVAARQTVGLHSHPVILHREPYHPWLEGQRDIHVFRLRVLQDVGERLLQDAVHGGYDGH